MVRKLLDDCFLHDKDRMRHDECLALITSRLASVADVTRASLNEAFGRYCAEPVDAPRNVPLHDNSAVDGYAFAHADYLAAEGKLPVSERITAGDTKDTALAQGTAARIFTGARMPQGADTVAMQEDCTVGDDGKQIAIPPGLKRGANCRLAGEDLKTGDPVITTGQKLRPQDIAAIASLGKGEVPVFEKLRVAVLSNGDELVEPGGQIAPGLVFDSNRAMLKALLQTLPVKVTDIGILRDDKQKIEDAITDAAASHDLILTTGGASLGEEDHIISSIGRLGKLHSWQIAIKPGRPMAFGQIDDCVFLGLPGNPVAAFVCFLLYARPALTIMGGGSWTEPLRLSLPAGFEIARKKPDRREFQRGWLEANDDGVLEVRKFQRDGSGLISGLRQATGLIELIEEATSVAPGSPVRFIPFAELGISL